MFTVIETILQFSLPGEVPAEMLFFLLPNASGKQSSKEMQSTPAVSI